MNATGAAGLTTAASMAASKVKELFDTIRKSDPYTVIETARTNYLKAVEKLSVLGQCVRENENGLVAIAPIRINQPITAFAPDMLGIPVTSPIKGKTCSVIDGQTYVVNGPSAKNMAEGLKINGDVFKECIVPLDSSFAPVTILIADPGVSTLRPDLAAIAVAGVGSDNPYKGVDPTEENLPIYVQITLNYFNKVGSSANCMVQMQSGLPTVLIATRKILPGEVIRTARPPSFWIKDVDYLQKIETELKKIQDDGSAGSLLGFSN